MKFLKSAVVVFILTATFFACKKDDAQPSFSIEGTWTGKIGTGNATPNGQYALNIKPGGGLERINASGAVSASGTWQMAGNTFTGTYTYSSGTVVSFTASINKAARKITGTWQNQSEQGTFHATKSTL
jgi:hypothetical protein